RIRALIEPEDSLPAAGQGALGLEIRADRADIAAWLAPLHDDATAKAVEAERMVSRALGGSCTVPLAAYAQWHDGKLALRGTIAMPDASRVLAAQEATAASTLDDAMALGRRVADDLIAQGALEIVRALADAAQAADGPNAAPASGGAAHNPTGAGEGPASR
ncbi:hydroxymethylbilane synthase, partial [Paraburkholderia sp. BR14261]